MKVASFLALASVAHAEIRGPYPDGVPGSGYGCDNKCNRGDVNYVIEAALSEYSVPGSKASGLGNGEQDINMFTRTFQGIGHESSPFCLDMDGNNGPLGPCIRVIPGQTMNIKIVNNMDNGMGLLKQHQATIQSYWEAAMNPAENLDNITYFGKAPTNASDMKISNPQNIPGMDVSFDDTNLHIHGMQVAPHLFFPQGTGNATAEWITISPSTENSDQKCFCYVFEVPEDHPQGTFFYHIHRHGSTAMQGWQGMMGYLLVGDEESDGAPEKELVNQGINREEPLALWEWAVDTTNSLDNRTFMEGQFLGDMDQIFLTNDEFQPSFDMCVNETVHFRILCAQATTGSALYVIDENDEEVTFWVFGADGISYEKAYEKRALLIGPGQREAVLLQFNTPGTYRIMQLVINDFQGEGEIPDGDKDNGIEPAAIIVVSAPGENNCTEVSPVNLPNLNFTKGIDRDVSLEEIDHQVSVNFEVQSQLDRVPVPQFVIDGEAFDVRRISQKVPANSSQQWTLSSNMNYFHPFHIHVNPFQVADVFTGFLPGTLPTGVSLEEALVSTVMEPAHQYRDTTLIPPYGFVSIYQKFGASVSWSGKTVYHCHFLDHEDQGMIAAMMIANPDTAAPTDGSVSPSEIPSASPSKSPSASPSGRPSAAPSESPSAAPSIVSSSESPSANPSSKPTASASDGPTWSPTDKPSRQPTPEAPTLSPSSLTESPTTVAFIPPTTFGPIANPTSAPTFSSTVGSPTFGPGEASTASPTHSEDTTPTETPSLFPRKLLRGP